MAKLNRLPQDDFNRDVTAVACDERFILVGAVDGKLSAVFLKNGNRVFSSKISEASITAVCCEEQDDVENPIFYAGDSDGNLFTVNKKGNIIAQAKIPNRKGEIQVIANRGKYAIYAYTSNGTTSFSHTTSDFRKGNFSASSANYSVDGDGTFHRRQGAGDYKVIQFDGRTPSRVVGTIGLEFGKKPKDSEYEQVHVYAVTDEEYENLIEDGTSEKTLKVMNAQAKQIRELEFSHPVKQVMSCRHHQDNAKADKIYIMLWNGAVYSVTGNMLMDESVSDDALDLKLAVERNVVDEEDDDEQGELRGFCVYNNKIVIYGNDGLMIGTLSP